MAPSADEISQEFIQESIHLLRESTHKINHCLNQLDSTQIWWRPEPGLNSIGNLILHLCGNLNQWAVCGITESKSNRQREQEFSSEAHVSLEDLREKITAHCGSSVSNPGISVCRGITGKPRNSGVFSFSTRSHFTHSITFCRAHTSDYLHHPSSKRGTVSI